MQGVNTLKVVIFLHFLVVLRIFCIVCYCEGKTLSLTLAISRKVFKKNRVCSSGICMAGHCGFIYMACKFHHFRIHVHLNHLTVVECFLFVFWLLAFMSPRRVIILICWLRPLTTADR